MTTVAGHCRRRLAEGATDEELLVELTQLFPDARTPHQVSIDSYRRQLNRSSPGVDLGSTLLTRRRRSSSEDQQLKQQIIDILRDDHPQSVRHIFYRMTNPRLPEPVAKTDSGTPNGYLAVQKRLTSLRREGTIPYWWITDATRRGYHVATYTNAADFLRRNLSSYRGNLWQKAGCYVEVWCESRSIAGVIQGVCEDLAVSLYPAGGFPSISLVYEAAEQITDTVRAAGKPAHVIYIGDYDPAGVLIDRSVENELRRHLPVDIELTIHRLAVTEKQIKIYNLPTKPRKPKDHRAPHVKETVEAEAMPAALLRELLRNTVESFLPPDALKVVKVAEESERGGLERWAEILEAAGGSFR